MSSVANNAMGPVQAATPAIQKLSEAKEIRDAAIHKFHQHQHDAKVHGFKDSDKADHIKNWKVLTYAEEKVSYGINYFMKVEIDAAKDHTVHIRVHRQQHHDKYDFYSLHETIKNNIATYVWSAKEPLKYFNA